MTDQPAATVRPADSRDLPLLALLRRQWTAEQDGYEVVDARFDDAFADWVAGVAGERLFWIAVQGEVPVGMVNVAVFTRMPRPGRARSRWGYVSNVYVSAGHRNRGVGAELLGACLQHARANGFVRMVLSPSERSVPFYERAGFRPADGLMVLPL